MIRSPLVLLACLSAAFTPQALIAQNPPPEPLSEYMGRRIARTMHWMGAEWLLRETREAEERPSQLHDALKVQAGWTVCDLGAGNGYHSLELARRVGATGKVLAVDIQPEMLRMLDARAKEAGIENIELIEALSHDPRLPAASCDLVLMVDVYHELYNPDYTLPAIRRALKPGGRVVLVEFREEDPAVPIKPEHKMSKAQINTELLANGFALAEEFDELPWQHVMFFERAPTTAGRGRRGQGRGRRGNAAPDRLVWVDRDGNRGESIGEPHRIITGPTLSPDGKLLAVREGDGNDDIFVYDLETSTRTRITSDEASDMHPQWTADGTRLAFFTYRNGLADIYIKDADGGEPETPLANGPFHEYHPDFTPDGKSVVFHHHDPDTDLRDIWTQPLAGGEPTLVVSAEGSEGMPRLSKDGRFMAYQSNESGQYEVYVVAFPSGEGKVKVSSGGGNWPRWSNDELFFFSNNTLMAVSANPGGEEIELGEPEALFTTEEVGMQNTRSSQFNAKYGVSPDGQRFLIVVR